VKRHLPKHLGNYRAGPQQIECLPRSVLPSTPCASCGRGTGSGAAFKRTLDRAASGSSQFDALAFLIGALYPTASWLG
jgi:hypothetical protein